MNRGVALPSLALGPGQSMAGMTEPRHYGEIVSGFA